MTFTKPHKKSVETVPAELPTLTAPAAASDILSGMQAIDGEGNLIVGNHVCGEGLELPTLSAPASAADVVEGKTAYVNGSKITGTATIKTNSSNTRFGNGVGQINSFELMFCAGGDPTNYVRPI